MSGPRKIATKLGIEHKKTTSNKNRPNQARPYNNTAVKRPWCLIRQRGGGIKKKNNEPIVPARHWVRNKTKQRKYPRITIQQMHNSTFVRLLSREHSPPSRIYPPCHFRTTLYLQTCGGLTSLYRGYLHARLPHGQTTTRLTECIPHHIMCRDNQSLLGSRRPGSPPSMWQLTATSVAGEVKTSLVASLVVTRGRRPFARRRRCLLGTRGLVLLVVVPLVVLLLVLRLVGGVDGVLRCRDLARKSVSRQSFSRQRNTKLIETWRLPKRDFLKCSAHEERKPVEHYLYLPHRERKENSIDCCWGKEKTQKRKKETCPKISLSLTTDTKRGGGWCRRERLPNQRERRMSKCRCCWSRRFRWSM